MLDGANIHHIFSFWMIVQINIDSQVSSIRVFLQNLKIRESRVHLDKDIFTSALEQRFG
ncbi:hypothetical protein PVAP13_1KG213000 [Panicum virgatum]|uniref:Uncharacterized protein n=1 Tax=Panicum virgatum TaxID=38727 RepID=A0A8T0XLB3_PANVG|nr:hypothetical protein PVAP13_1KG213000 [Panicum virgatum]